MESVSSFFNQAFGPIGLICLLSLVAAYLGNFNKRNQIAFAVVMFFTTGAAIITVSTPELKTIYVGMMISTICTPFILNRNLRYYEETPVEVEVTKKTTSNMVQKTPREILEVVPLSEEKNPPVKKTTDPMVLN